MKKFLALAFVLVSVVACSGGSSKSSYGAYSSPYILASEFVSALNGVDGEYSYVELYTNETLRSAVYGQDDWFVIWDDKFNEYKAISLQYVRSIVYYDYYSNNHAVASEFRAIERDDILAGKLNGDWGGDDYEVVDYIGAGTYEGRESGYLYEDKAETRDTSLASKDAEQLKFFNKAAAFSSVYHVNFETSLSIVTLGNKVEKMLSRANNNELTTQDQAALSADIKTLTGVSLEELESAAQDAAKKQAVVAKVAEKVGTSAQNLEDKILPEVFGINL